MGNQRKESGMMNLTSYSTLKEFVEDGRYTIIVGPRNKSLLTRIKELYPEAVVTTSNADGIGGKKLLVDKLAADGLGLKSALPKFRIVDVVYENFTKQFVEGGNVTVNFSSKLHEGWEKAFNQIKQTTSESLRSSFIGYATGIHAHPYKEQGDEDYMDYCGRFFEGDVWKQKRQDILDSNKPLTKEDVSFDLNGKVPKLYIKGQEVWVVSMTNHYVSSHAWGEGTNVITFIYVTNDGPKQKVLSIDRITGEVMNQ
ncbi:hypothetical protein AB1I55_16385 [Enterococcus entomosocium]|uniref:Uncharacterized protein n=2 Tax=Enterococcus entomosocium TaxID=3034352 RepID=A0ABV3MGX7_9ENTE|nr:hypothetical protein [Enterococcus casseliflavus]MDB1710333.1 hypothetical protein [Enterococcus casseliflavus]